MLQKLLMYYLDSNIYYLEKVDILFAMLHDSKDETNLQILETAKSKLSKQGGRYTLCMTDPEIKKYLFFQF